MKKLISAVLSLLFVYMLCACNAPQRQQLSAPKNLRVENEMLEWDAVEHAEGYVVYFSDAEHETEEPRCDLSVLAPGEHEIDVLAVGSGQYLNSNWSTISYRKEAPVAHDYDEAGFEYTLLEDDSGYEIALGRADCLEVLEIPETFRGLPVKKVADEGFAPPFGKYNYATKVLKLPSCLEVIGTAAFWYFGSLEEVSIPDSVQEIGRYAFAEDYRLKRVSLPKGLKVIPDCCFESCAVEQIVFPENLIEIGQGAFSPSVNTGEYEQGNRDSAPDLFELEIPDSVKTIGIGAFSACYKLREIKFPKSLETLGMHAFDRTEWYDRQPDGFITIGDILYEYKGELEQDATVVIPSNIKRIAGGAFYGSHYSMNKKLAEVVIPDGVTFIGTAVFSGCRNLRRVRLPADLTDIPDETFACCESLTEIALPDGVVSVGETAFKYCISLNKLTLQICARSGRIASAIVMRSKIFTFLRGSKCLGNTHFRNAEPRRSSFR